MSPPAHAGVGEGGVCWVGGLVVDMCQGGGIAAICVACSRCLQVWHHNVGLLSVRCLAVLTYVRPLGLGSICGFASCFVSCGDCLVSEWQLCENVVHAW